MPKIELRAGAVLDTLSHDEMREVLAEHRAQLQELDRARGVKAIRLPLVIGTASGNALTMGGDSLAVPQGPDTGYFWSLRHLVIEGMTASSSTPDVMNVKRNNRTIWQLNGNSFCATFGRGEIILFTGETLQYVSVGTFASTAQIIAHGMAEQVPGEMIAKFLM